MKSDSDLSKTSLLSLGLSYVKGFGKLLSLEKNYVKQEISQGISISAVSAAVAIAGLIFLAIGGLTLIVCAVLVLNIWLAPWLSALIVAGTFLVIGLILALIGILNIKKGMNRAGSSITKAKEDIRWVRRKSEKK